MIDNTMITRHARRLATLLALLVPALLAPPAQARGLDSIAVVVNDDLILTSELDEAMRQIELQLRSQERPQPPRDVLLSRFLEAVVFAAHVVLGCGWGGRRALIRVHASAAGRRTRVVENRIASGESVLDLGPMGGRSAPRILTADVG